MMLLRNGGQFANSRMRSYLWVSLVSLALAFAISFLSKSFGRSALGFFAVAALVILFKTSVRSWQRWLLERKGESRVTETLRTLSDDYVILNDVVVPDSKGTVDHVLIGPNGVFVVETKNYSGFIKCLEDLWWVNGRPIRSLSKQAQRNSMAVRGCIASLFPGTQHKTPHVVPLLVFVGRIRLKLLKPTVCVLRLNELVGFIRARESNRVITADEKRSIVHHLQLLQHNFAEASDWSATVEENLPKAGLPHFRGRTSALNPSWRRTVFKAAQRLNHLNYRNDWNGK